MAYNVQIALMSNDNRADILKTFSGHPDIITMNHDEYTEWLGGFVVVSHSEELDVTYIDLFPDRESVVEARPELIDLINQIPE